MDKKITLSLVKNFSKTSHYEVLINDRTTPVRVVHYRSPLPGHWIIKNHLECGEFSSKLQLLDYLREIKHTKAVRPRLEFVPTR